MNYKEIYKEAVNELNPSPELVNKIKMDKEHKMIKFNKKKIAVVAAIACMTIGTSVFAAGHISSYVAWSNPTTENNDFSIVNETSEKMGINVNIPEKLNNGYSFKNSNFGGIKALDDDGNTLAKGKKFEITYEKNGCPDIYIDIDPAFEAEDNTISTQSKEINGVTVYYNKDTYKFVPTDYVLTDEDQANLDKPHYYLSYGSDEVEIKIIDSICFQIEDKNYTMMSWECDMTADEWFEMTEDFIK